MAAKDYIYLGLIALSAFVFYFYGVQTGVRRCRRVLATFVDYSETLNELPPETASVGKNPVRVHTFRRICRSLSRKSRSETAWLRMTRDFPGR